MRNFLLRTVSVTAFLVVLLGCAVLLSAEEQAGTAPEVEATPASGLHPHVPIVWLVVMLLTVIVYLRTAGWVDHETHRLGIKSDGWNVAFTVWIGVQAVLYFAVPVYVSVPAGLLGYVLLLNRFVHHRNQRVIDPEKVFTREHMDVLQRRFLAKFGIKSAGEPGAASALTKDHVPVQLSDSEGKMISPAGRLDKDETVQKLKDLLAKARDDRVRQLHLVSTGGAVQVLFCIDGVLHRVGELDLKLGSIMIMKVKSLVSVVGEAGQPEDALPAFQMEFPLRRQQLRGTVYGAVLGGRTHTIIRLTDASRAPVAVEQLGMDEAALAQVRRLTESSSGLMVFAGPPGSGRRSTMYAVLEGMDAYTRNIGALGVDAPARRLANITQERLDLSSGRSVGEVLTDMFRQDCNVVMVEGVTEAEGLRFCVETSREDHLILLGTAESEAGSVLSALLASGVEPGVRAAGLRVVVSQRLVRRLCPKCRRPMVPDAEVLSNLSAHLDDEEATFFEEVGCDACAGTGFDGRVGVFEFLPITDVVKEVLAGGCSVPDVLKAGRASGYVSLHRDALRKAARGVTSLKEIGRVLSGG